MRNTSYLKAGLILIFSILSINVYAQNPSKREPKPYTLPDGSKLICLVPPPEIMTKTDTRSFEATIPKIIDIIKQGGQFGGKIDRQRSFERIRQELSSLNLYEVLEYHLCMQVVGGVLTREEYKEAAKELRPTISVAHNLDIPNTPPEGTPSRKWQVVPIQSRDQDKTVVWNKSWRDIFWSGPEGWLCGAIDEGGGGGDVGRGILLHTKDGGYSWTEFDKNNFLSGQGTFTWGSDGNRQYSWFEVGPIYSCSWYRRAIGKGSYRTEAQLASATGIYFSDDGGMSWKRLTPPPDDPKRYAFFFRYANVEAGSEIYAVGWQGIAHWPGSGQRWELQMPTYSYQINSLMSGHI